jgi:hypothetical protein
MSMEEEAADIKGRNRHSHELFINRSEFHTSILLVSAIQWPRFKDMAGVSARASPEQAKAPQRSHTSNRMVRRLVRLGILFAE